MAVNFSHFNIFTNNKNKLVNFLTQIFDVEISEKYFNMAGVFINLLESDCSDSGKSVISLFVDDQEELDMIVQKANFYYYRTPDLTQEQKDHIASSPLQEHSSKAVIVDPDNRVWEVCC